MAPDRPNIIFVCSDQHGHRYTGFDGHENVETPNLDQIADRGIVFENAYCGSPVCTPSRASMMTGVYPSDVSSFCNSTVWDGSHPTWGSRLRTAGYRTWATGKLELNPEHEVGFDEVDTTHGHYHSPDITSLFRRPVGYRVNVREMVNGRSREKRHADSTVSETAETFIREDAAMTPQPWAAWVGFSQPHPPFVALEEHYDHFYPSLVDLPNVPLDHLEDQHLAFDRLRAFKRIATPIPEDRIRRARAGYYGMIAELDEYIGRLWSALDRAGELDDTIFIYTSDHGEMLGEHGLWYKNNLYEDAAHVPLVVAGPGLPEGETVEMPVGHVDLVHTLLEWAGAELPTPQRGNSLTPVIEGRPNEHPGYAYCENHSEGNCTGLFMIRTEEWKYLNFTGYDDVLFNLKEDPQEDKNRINDPGAEEALERLRALLHEEVDPDAVTERAFEEQAAFLKGLVNQMEKEEFFETLCSRLGPGQAQVITDRYGES